LTRVERWLSKSQKLCSRGNLGPISGRKKRCRVLSNHKADVHEVRQLWLERDVV